MNNDRSRKIFLNKKRELMSKDFGWWINDQTFSLPMPFFYMYVEILNETFDVK